MTGTVSLYSREADYFSGKGEEKQEGERYRDPQLVPEPYEGPVQEVGDRLMVHSQQDGDLVMGEALVVAEVDHFLLAGGKVVKGSFQEDDTGLGQFPFHDGCLDGMM